MLCRRGLDTEVLAKRLRNVLKANNSRSLSKFDHYWTALSKPQADEKDKVPAIAVQVGKLRNVYQSSRHFT